MNFSKYRAEQITLYGNPVSPSGQDREIGLTGEKSRDRVVRFLWVEKLLYLFGGKWLRRGCNYSIIYL